MAHTLIVTKKIPSKTFLEDTIEPFIAKHKKDEYYVWELRTAHIPEKDVACEFDYDKESFYIDNDVILNGVKYKKGNHSLKRCKTINKFFNELKKVCSTMTVVGHRKIDGTCLDELLWKN